MLVSSNAVLQADAQTIEANRNYLISRYFFSFKRAHTTLDVTRKKEMELLK